MANFNHQEFTPEFNRIRNKPVVLTGNDPDRLEQFPVDPEFPYRPIHYGYHTVVAKGAFPDVTFGIYVASTMRPSGFSTYVFLDKGQDPKTFFEAAPWKEALEKYKCSAVFIAPDGDWDIENPGKAIEYARQVLEKGTDNEYFGGNADACSCIGFGSGAYIASLYSILYSRRIAAFAADGDFSAFTQEVAAAAGDLPTDTDPWTLKKDNPVPAWIIDRNGSGSLLLDFMKHANKAREDGLYNDAAKVWLQKPDSGELFLNTQAVAQTWYTDKQEMSFEEQIDKMLAFVTNFHRWGDINNGALRNTRTEEDYGLIRKDIVVDGRKRYFFVYEPKAYKNDPDKKNWPLVVAIHGFSCTGHFYAENSNWTAVAEQRGFLLVFPTAYPEVNKRSKILRPLEITPLPAWNSSVEYKDDQAPQELHYFEKLFEIVESEYRVCPERIYVSGHSNGSQMTQYLMRFMPKKFAAWAPIGLVDNFAGEYALPDDGITRPVWYYMGQYDIGEGWSLAEDSANVATLKSLCASNKADWEGAHKYESGIYKNTVCYNADHVPVVTFTGVEGWPHTVTPETSVKIWDEFFCKFRRKADGTSVYLG